MTAAVTSDLLANPDFIQLRNLRIHRVIPGVFSVRDARMPWRRRAAESDRIKLLLDASSRFGVSALWLDSRFESLASALQPVSERLLGSGPDDWCGWFIAEESALSALARDAQGGWGCFFFHNPLDELPKISPLPSDPRGLLELKGRLKAEMAIVSEIDDAYWLVSWAPSSGGRG
jgi:hypothetical protein